MVRLILPFSFIVCIAANSAHALTTFLICNDYGSQVTLWTWPENAKDWNRPPIRLTTRRPTQRVELSSGVKHYLVVTDAFRSSTHFEWIDFDQLVRGKAQNEGDATVYLSYLVQQEERSDVENVVKYRTESRVEHYKVVQMVPETRTKTVQYWDAHLGRWATKEITYTVCKPVWETRARSYNVQVPYTEQATKTYTVEVRTPVLKLVTDGEVQIIRPK